MTRTMVIYQLLNPKVPQRRYQKKKETGAKEENGLDVEDYPAETKDISPDHVYTIFFSRFKPSECWLYVMYHMFSFGSCIIC